MPELRLSDFVGKRLKDIYHEGQKDKILGKETPEGNLVIEFENDYRIVLQGVGQYGFMVKKERIGGEPEIEKQERKKENKKAISERKAKESKQKNRKKEK